MFEIPDAAPTWATGTALVAIDEHGPLESAKPGRDGTRGRTKAAYEPRRLRGDEDRETDGRRARTRATITIRLPRRFAIFGTIGASTTSPAVAGIVANPVSSALSPSVSGLWK